jgi:hypothetical protein
MDVEEREELLGAGGTGVLSLPRDADDPPHTVPVSYGYDAESGQFYFRLAFGADSEKRGVATDGAPASFVTYHEADDGWRSVVATGSLTAIDEEHVDTEVLEGMRRVELPLLDIFEEETRTVEFRFFRLAPETLTGRKEDPIRE